jgi:flavin reductase (DIM6/NTAB) family NADH-FMN oxidoreductase RutF
MFVSTQDVGQAFKQAMRGLGSSVTILSTELACVRYGMVATAAMSVSMEPASMVVAINRSASIHNPLIERGAFVVNILTHWDKSLVEGFARASGEGRFANGPWSTASISDRSIPLPYLANAVASVFLTVADVFASGTHSLVVGHVQRVALHSEKHPLLYCDGTYGSFKPFRELCAAETSAA